MSLYFEASAVLANEEKRGGSLKSRIFGNKTLKNPPAKVYALVVESLKWSPFLKEVIERSNLLNIERKLTPPIAVLLVHDLLLSKGGITTPRTHPLRTAVEKHKARLAAEFTRCRIRQGFGSVEAFRDHISGQAGHTLVTEQNGTSQSFRHPRWIRINSLRTTLADQLAGTFEGYKEMQQLEDVLCAPSKERIVYKDRNIPDLIAVPYGHDLSKTKAYDTGQIIFQDKASCFPAYLLDPASCNSDIIDTCAAPGNKTTHLAALIHTGAANLKDHCKVFAFERNPQRSIVLKKMITRAGGDNIITVFGNKDFLTADPKDNKFANVGALLLDPSCSGTGIVGRDDEPKMHLPEFNATVDTPKASKKRKKSEVKQQNELQAGGPEAVENELIDDGNTLEERLRTLSAFQLQLVQHAMKFPKATRITYSTCSIHGQENEMVVMKALASKTAQQEGWRILKRDEQADGLRNWEHRGIKQICTSETGLSASTDSDEIADACIRCEKGTKDGTMGFFVAAFTRDQVASAMKGYVAAEVTEIKDHETQDDGEWEGFSDGDEH